MGAEDLEDFCFLYLSVDCLVGLVIASGTDEHEVLYWISGSHKTVMGFF